MIKQENALCLRNDVSQGTRYGFRIISSINLEVNGCTVVSSSGDVSRNPGEFAGDARGRCTSLKNICSASTRMHFAVHFRGSVQGYQQERGIESQPHHRITPKEHNSYLLTPSSSCLPRQSDFFP